MSNTYLRGSAVIAKVGASTPAEQAASTNCSLNLSANTEDVTTKDDVADDGTLYPQNEVTYVSGELSIDGYIKSASDILTIDCGDAVKWAFVSGKRTYTGDGIVTSLNFTGDMNSIGGYSMTVQSSGKITKSVTA